jgi:hypothetical protein
MGTRGAIVQRVVDHKSNIIMKTEGVLSGLDGPVLEPIEFVWMSCWVSMGQGD